jgi:CD109 antigen
VRKTQSVLLEDSESAEFSVAVPEDAVPGSVSARVTVIGDILGPTLEGLERLVRVPCGCGEQNMITLAPNVYVARYLQAVDRLSPELRGRLENNLLVGFQRELTYMLRDGSFSAFGESDGEGSMWLTAFVLQVFAEIEQTQLIVVDGDVLIRAANWITSQQSRDGSFPSRGMVIHKEMQGGLVGAASSLTAFVLSALLEAKACGLLPAASLDDAIERAKVYLASQTYGIGSADEKYALVMASTIQLRMGVDGAGATLARARESVGSLAYYPGGSSATDVELTGYAIGALCVLGDLAAAAPAARWITSKRNDVGGFVSTQDTVVALRALATFAAEVAGSVDVNVAVSYGSARQDFAVGPSNFDLLQQWTPPSPAGSVTVSASGSGMVLVSASLAYNALVEEVPPVYSLEVEWTETDGIWECGISVVDKERRVLREAAAAEAGEERALKPAGTQPGMLLADIGVFTGFTTANAEAQLRASPGGSAVKRVEAGPHGNVLVYLSGEVEDLRFTAQEAFAVKNRTPAHSKVIDYYEPERTGSAAVPFEEVKLKVSSTDAPPPPPDDFASSAIAAGLRAVAAVALVTAH